MRRTRKRNIYRLLAVIALWGIAVALGFIAFQGSTESSEPFVFDYPLAQAPVVNGVNGVDGKNGVDGIDGVDGKDGLDGRNCLPATTVVDGVVIEYEAGYEGEIGK